MKTMSDQDQAPEVASAAEPAQPAASGDTVALAPEVPQEPELRKLLQSPNIGKNRFDPADVQETWRRNNLPGRLCEGCGSPKVAVQIVVFMPTKEFVKRAPEIATLVASKNDGKLPVAKFNDEAYTCVSDTCACGNCQKVAEKAAAALPSWVLCEIRKAPKAIAQFSFQRRG